MPRRLSICLHSNGTKKKRCNTARNMQKSKAKAKSSSTCSKSICISMPSNDSPAGRPTRSARSRKRTASRSSESSSSRRSRIWPTDPPRSRPPHVLCGGFLLCLLVKISFPQPASMLQSPHEQSIRSKSVIDASKCHGMCHNPERKHLLRQSSL